MELRVGDRSTIVRAQQGTLQLYDLGGGVRLHVSRGTVGRELADVVIADGEKALAEHGRCIFLVDCSESSLLSGEFRERIADWYRAHLSDAIEAHVLIRSRLIEIAVNALSNALRLSRVRTYSTVEEWEAVGRKLVPGFARRPMARELT